MVAPTGGDPDRPNHGGVIEGAIADQGSTDPEALNRAYTSAAAQNRR